MKLLFVIDHLGPAGAQTQLVTLGTSLKVRGHTVEFFIYYPRFDHFRNTLDAAGIPVHVSPKNSRNDIRPLIRLRRLIKTGKYDFAISYLTTPNIYNVLAALKTTTKTIVSERSSFHSDHVPRSVGLRFGMYRLADCIVVNSRHHHRRLCEEFPWMEERSRIIANGVDLARFAPANSDRQQGSADSDTLLAVGSIHSGKNHKGLVEALHIYQTTYGEPLRIHWAGRDPVKQADIIAHQEARASIRNYGLGDSWEWLGVRSDIPELLQQHDAFIHPSFFEGLPNAVCEALATGTPVLASDVSDHRWLVSEGETGFLFDPHNPTDIARAIRRFILLTSEQKRTMARKARAFAEQELAVDVFVDAYERLFGSMQ